MNIVSFGFKRLSLHQVLKMTLGFVMLSRISNATIEVTIAGMFRSNGLSNGSNDGTGVVCFLTDVARDTVSSIVTALLTPSLMLLMTFLFGTNRKRELV